MQRSINGDIVYSTFDELPDHHIKVAEMVLERAQRLVEHGRDVVVLLDSITRLARAYNQVVPSTGRILSGGLDSAALHKPKGSSAAPGILKKAAAHHHTTALVETGSRWTMSYTRNSREQATWKPPGQKAVREKDFPCRRPLQIRHRREDLLMNQKELEGVWLSAKPQRGTA